MSSKIPFSFTILSLLLLISNMACQTPVAKDHWDQASTKPVAKIAPVKRDKAVDNWDSPAVKTTIVKPVAEVLKEKLVQNVEEVQQIDNKAGSSQFVVQIGAFENVENAKKLVEKLKKKEVLATYRSFAHTNGKQLQVLQVRSLKSFEAAKSIGDQVLEAAGDELEKIYITKDKKIHSWMKSDHFQARVKALGSSTTQEVVEHIAVEPKVEKAEVKKPKLEKAVEVAPTISETPKSDKKPASVELEKKVPEESVKKKSSFESQWEALKKSELGR